MNKHLRFSLLSLSVVLFGLFFFVYQAYCCVPSPDTPCAAVDTIYVDSSASGNFTGSDWQNAYTDLQTAISNATKGTIICVAKGTYYPHSSDRNISFTLKDSVAIFGGYSTAGIVRNVDAYSTILSGEIQQDGDSTNNSLIIISAGEVGACCRIDGLTITDAYGYKKGGGMKVIGGSPVITRCTFKKNTCSSDHLSDSCCGAALFILNGSPVLKKCSFLDNRCFHESDNGYHCYGGALYSSGGSTVLNRCNFSDNFIDPKTGVRPHGGAVYISDGRIDTCIFTDNKSMGIDLVSSGGAVYMINGSITGCSFSENKCSCIYMDGKGGAVYAKYAELSYCTFTGNRANSADNYASGAAIHMEDGLVTHCLFNENNASTAEGFISGGTMFMKEGAAAYCIFINNRHSATSPSFCYGGTINMKEGLLNHCSFFQNQGNSGRGGGGVLLMENGSLTNCTFSDNAHQFADYGSGGAVHARNGFITNCTFFNNSLNALGNCTGGALFMESGCYLTNCTFYQNHATGGSASGGAVDISNGSITNCIFWNNSADSYNEIYGSPASIKNCVIQGGYSGGGTVSNIITTDPYLGPLTYCTNSFVKISPIDNSSSAYNQGTTDVHPDVDITHDACGKLRDAQPDIGAYEFGVPRCPPGHRRRQRGRADFRNKYIGFRRVKSIQ